MQLSVQFSVSDSPEGELPYYLTVNDGSAEMARGSLDDADVTGLYSLFIEPTDWLRFGLIFQDELELDLEGSIQGAAVSGTSLDLDLPLAQRLTMSLNVEATDELTLLFTFGWEDWSTLDAINLSTESNGAVLDRNWEDTYHFAIGGTYRIDSEWVLQAGIGYDTSPVDADDRTADLPIDRQVRYAFGLTRTLPSGLEVSGSLVYADYGDAEIDALGFEGDYSSNDLLFASMSFNWRR